MQSGRRRRALGSADEPSSEQTDFTHRRPVDYGILVGGPTHGCSVYNIYGTLYQMLCGSHALFESKEASGPEDQRYVAKTDEYAPEDGELNSSTLFMIYPVKLRVLR